MNIPLLDTRTGVRSEFLGLGFEKLDRDVFAETAGGTLSMEDGFVYFEQCLPLHLVGRGEGETVVKAFIANALEWRRRIGNMGGDDGVQHFDGLTV